MAIFRTLISDTGIYTVVLHTVPSKEQHLKKVRNFEQNFEKHSAKLLDLKKNLFCIFKSANLITCEAFWPNLNQNGEYLGAKQMLHTPVLSFTVETQL